MRSFSLQSLRDNENGEHCVVHSLYDGQLILECRSAAFTVAKEKQTNVVHSNSRYAHESRRSQYARKQKEETTELGYLFVMTRYVLIGLKIHTSQRRNYPKQPKVFAQVGLIIQSILGGSGYTHNIFESKKPYFLKGFFYFYQKWCLILLIYTVENIL